MRIGMDAALAEDIGRLLIVGFEGSQAPEAEDLILSVRPAGLVFFKRNYPGSPEKMRELTTGLQKLAEARLGRRLLMAIDHEGGLVQRLPEPYTRVPSAEEASLAEADPVKAAETAALGARELARSGFNFNLAPVLDVSAGPGSFMSGRSFSEDPDRVIEMGRAYLRAFWAAGILGAGKHFPGLGRAVLDPHHELPTIDAPSAGLAEIDLRPFKALAGEGLSAVMTTHALYPALDARRPATLSAAVVGLLKNDLAFPGAVLTDDLEMGAVVKNYPLGQAAVEAVAAGHDLALICRRRDYIEECREALAEAVGSGLLPRARLMDAHRRSGLLLGRLHEINQAKDSQ